LIGAFLWSACDADSGPASYDEVPTTAEVMAELSPAPPVLLRLTRLQYQNALRDLFGDLVTWPAGLEPDVPSHGLLALGAGVSSVSPLGVERYERAARDIASELMETEAGRAYVLPCDPGEAGVEACLEATIARWGPKIWRRPMSEDETEAIMNVGMEARETLGSFEQGVEYALMAMLQSPYFLYRFTVGEEDAESAGQRRYTSWEMASRLSFFLWNSIPDDTLFDAAANGALVTPSGIAAQVDRMVADGRFEDGLKNFFAEWLDLYALDALVKDPTIYKHYSPVLGGFAREETLRLVTHLFAELDAPYHDLFTTRTTFVNRHLAAVYNVPAVAEEGFGEITLPEDGTRRGFLGQVSFLAHNAHAVASSPTLRGLFVRERLLCQTIESPPSEVNPAIPEPSPDAVTLRERLMTHMEDPVCGGCHALLDPIGFGFENYDGVGRYRVLDNGGDIVATGTLDGITFDGASELADALVTNAALVPCFVQRIYAYATGHQARSGESGQLGALEAAFEAGSFRVPNLFKRVANSPGFRLLDPAVVEVD